MHFYRLFCNLYSNLISYFENIFFRKHNPTNIFKTSGIKVLKNYNSLFYLGSPVKNLKPNRYHQRNIYLRENINKFLEELFNQNLRCKITKLTGFSYSIDYFGAYENFYIEKIDRKLGFYANHYHLDKPYSKNLLKIFIPL